MFSVGILLAFAALLFWGFGDFLIQKSTRRLGDWETLFMISIFGFLVLSPFVYNDMISLFSYGDQTLLILFGVSTTVLCAALLDFEALKKGKIAVIEPVYALEVPMAVILSFAIINEVTDFLQIIVMTTLVAGLVLVTIKSHHFSRKAWLEKGVILALIGSFFMGLTNFFVGFAARITNPLMVNWFISLFLAMICLFYLMSEKRLHHLLKDMRTEKRVVLGVCTLDNLAWVSFAVAMTLIPIAIAVALSESYIALAALLGLLINKERLMVHQKFGLVMSLSSAVFLAILTA
jgi:drug/metabolite transporter (DMT)-like permease